MTSTTIEKKYTTNSIINKWLTLRTKLNQQNKEVKENIDFEKYNITIE